MKDLEAGDNLNLIIKVSFNVTKDISIDEQEIVFWCEQYLRLKLMEKYDL